MNHLIYCNYIDKVTISWTFVKVAREPPTDPPCGPVHLLERVVTGSGKLDRTDVAILRLLQHDGRLSNAQIARELKVATSTVFERVRKLEERGVIRGFEARLDARAVGLGVTAFVFIAATEIARENAVEQALLAMPEVLEIHKIAGEDAFLAKVRAPDNETLGRRLHEGIEAAGVRSIRTTIVLATAREETALDLRHLEEG